MSDIKITVQNASDGFGICVQNYNEGDDQLVLTFLDDEGAPLMVDGVEQSVYLDFDAARHLAQVLPVAVGFADSL